MALTKPTTATVTFFGAAGADYLIGTSGDDTFSGAVSANPLVFVADGTDTFEGLDGNDVYIVNDIGDSVIEAVSAGIDTVFSSVTYTLPSEVENIAATGGSATTLTGNTKDNILDGTTSNAAKVNTLQGMEGSDTYFLEAADKVIEGKLVGAATQYTDTGGIDTLYIAATAAVAIDKAINNIDQLSTGADKIKGQAFIENVVLTGTSAVNITGNALANRLTGNNAVNKLTGNAGDDVLNDGGAGAADTLIGGLGNDTYIIRNAGAIITESTTVNEGTDTVKASVTFDISDADLKFVENITLVGNAMDATGNDFNNVLMGNGKDNTLTGNAGIDTLNGGLGADDLIGGTGNDVYVVDNVNDVVTEVLGATPSEIAVNGAADRVDSSVTYSLLGTAAGVENLTLTGLSAINGTGNIGNNIITGNTLANTLNGGDGNDILTGGDGNDTLNGGNNDDKLFGGNNNDALNGGAGNDTLDGGLGTDVLKGGAGNDTYIVDNAGELSASGELATASEIDTVLSSVSYTLPANIENLTLTGLGVLDPDTHVFVIDGTGNAAKNIMIGNTSNNILTGAGGADTVTTGAGKDTLKFAAGIADTVATASSVAGIDVYKDLAINAGTLDRIDLTVGVARVGIAVTATIAEASFIANMNSALKVSGKGFDTGIAGDISAAIVTATTGGGGVTAGDKFLAVDLNGDNSFTAADFVIEITGSTVTSLTTDTFI